MIPRIQAYVYMMIFLCLVTLAGCSRTETYNKNYFILDTDRPTEPVGTQTDFILEVTRLSIDSAFSDNGLVYRVSEAEYESDFYNAFIASPSAMITDAMRNWLSMSLLFTRVLDPGSQVDPTHIIEGNITALYGDFRDRSAPKATIEMRLFLLETQTGDEPLPVFGKTYKTSIDLASEDPEGLVEAYSRCLQKILSILEGDLTERLT